MSCTDIKGLSAALVPQARFPNRMWYGGPGGWYYHGPANGKRVIRYNERFYSLIDPTLRPLVQLLNEWGLETTPSCEGHFFDRDCFEKIWDTLAAERAKIHNGGMIVEDSESGEAYRFRDKNYELPWRDCDEFCRQAMARQSVGYLGIRLSEQSLDRAALLIGACEGVAGARATRRKAGRGAIISWRVETGDAEAQTGAWARIGEQLLLQAQSMRHLPSRPAA